MQFKQPFRADQFFTEAQRERLSTLMLKWRTARNSETELSAAERAELEALVEAETIAMMERTQELLTIQ